MAIAQPISPVSPHPARVLATCLGYPRIGVARELKKALESFWSGRSSPDDLMRATAELRKRHWRAMKANGLDHIPSNDFSLYDHVLDMAVAVGAVPARYRRVPDPLARYFAMARGLQDGGGLDLPALEMTKWFDTNYHYIVPELDPGQAFALDASKIVGEVEQARELGLETRPVIPGPVTFLLLSKLAPGAPAGASPLDLLDALLPVYQELLGELATRKVEWLQVDEPCLVMDLDGRARDAYRRAWTSLAASPDRPRLLVATYFGALRENLPLAVGSGCDALHLDLVRAPDQLEAVLPALPSSMMLSLGVVDGRNVWRTDLDAAHGLVRRAVEALGPAQVMVAPSSSLMHVPVDLLAETRLDPELSSWLAFAEQKLGEVRALADAAELETGSGGRFDTARRALSSRRRSPRVQDAAVRARLGQLSDAMLHRGAPYSARAAAQDARFRLPFFPATTIGSFPRRRRYEPPAGPGAADA
jgi:5-methyltetrahydropteroyltriglutamate--homocysteine methyltransferase